MVLPVRLRRYCRHHRGRYRGRAMQGKCLSPSALPCFEHTTLNVPLLQFEAYLCYSLALTGFVYPVVVYSIWSSSGFLTAFNNDPFLGCGMHDFAGSGVVHMTGGATALVAAKVLGPRIGEYLETVIGDLLYLSPDSTRGSVTQDVSTTPTVTSSPSRTPSPPIPSPSRFSARSSSGSDGTASTPVPPSPSRPPPRATSPPCAPSRPRSPPPRVP